MLPLQQTANLGLPVGRAMLSGRPYNMQFMDGEETIRKEVGVQTLSRLLQILWPDFIVEGECVFTAFHGGSKCPSGTKTEWECFVNHTHLFDEFSNEATFKYSEQTSEDFEVVEELYDVSHPDFATACAIGKAMARMWAMKLKADFPSDRFRVYYTQFDNPIVRFHKVRAEEDVWLSDEALLSSADPSLKNAMIYNTEYLETPIIKN